MVPGQRSENADPAESLGEAVDSPMTERPQLVEHGPWFIRIRGILDPAYIPPIPLSSQQSYSKNGVSGLNVTSSGRPAVIFLPVVIFIPVVRSCSSLHFFTHFCL